MSGAVKEATEQKEKVKNGKVSVNEILSQYNKEREEIKIHQLLLKKTKGL
jgi:hypothetical protein